MSEAEGAHAQPSIDPDPDPDPDQNHVALSEAEGAHAQQSIDRSRPRPATPDKSSLNAEQ
jgi:hypothetical protein